MAMFAGAFQGKTVWLSGHTGFKGAWLARWLLQLGARVHGFSLPPPTRPALFEQLGLARRMEHEIGDVRDPGAVKKSLTRAQPDFVFHLAAQALATATGSWRVACGGSWTATCSRSCRPVRWSIAPP